MLYARRHIWLKGISAFRNVTLNVRRIESSMHEGTTRANNYGALTVRTTATVVLMILGVMGDSSAQAPTKIGFITTLSTPAGYLGQDMRDGFQLAIKEEGGKLGGIPVELTVSDDGANPNTGALLAQRMTQQEGIRIFSGTIFTSVALAIVPDLLRAGAFLISSNAAPKEFDGKNCNPSYVALAWHNEAPGETAAIAANESSAKRVISISANYSAGLEQAAAFKRGFKGQVDREILVRLNQTDFAVEISEIKAAAPDGIYMFLPGGMGISFLRQMGQAGITSVKQYTGTTVDGQIMKAVGKAGINVIGSTTWGPELDNAANKHFVAAYQESYKRPAGVYAANGYDAARFLASALHETKGNLSNVAEFQRALRSAQFESVRGGISLGRSQHVVQDWYMTQAVQGADGEYHLRITRKLVTDYGSPYADECPFKTN
jgi:branched-chain amino acid transport system substrate-binding protein